MLSRDILDGQGSYERTIRAKVTEGWKKWKDMASLLTNKAIPLGTRGRVNEVCVISVMLYGAEIWVMTERLENSLKSSDSRMLRCITGIKWEEGTSDE